MRLAAALLVLAAVAASAQPARTTSCIQCHAELHQELVAEFLDQDVHRRIGLSCHDCHGGNPAAAVADDMEAAMDPGFAANPYRGVPAAAAIPEFCGRCHSDPSFMRRFVADPRVDQVQEYWTSRHGELLRRGDAKVATCISCHGVHGMLATTDPDAPVHPVNLAETCRSCHGSPEYMRGYPIPVDQYARWRQSVHAAALLEGGDRSAPTCNDCHGDHGALPPGVASITYICGHCHGREATLFRDSPKEQGFARHADMLAEAERCDACHASSEPQAELERELAFTECTTCHGNHGVVRATVAMLSPLPETPCVFCHGEEGGQAIGGAVGEEIRVHFAEVRDALLRRASELGLDDEERFNWLVGQARELEFHTSGEGAERRPREHFERLWSKFRIGTTYYTFEGPAGSGEVRAPVLRCSDCHAAEPELAAEPVGHRAAADMVRAMQELTQTTARAERLLLAARRGGVETRRADSEIDGAVDAMIQLEVLVHTFVTGEGSEFEEKHSDGMAHASAALEAATAALEELQFRRAGLAASLIVILVVLVALGLKIRQLGPG